MALKSKLPEYISFANIGLATVAVSLLQPTRIIEPGIEDLLRLEEGPVTLHITPSIVSLYNRKMHTRDQGASPVNSLDELKSLLMEPTLSVGEHKVIPDKTGVQIGCQKIDWATVHQVAALDPTRTK